MSRTHAMIFKGFLLIVFIVSVALLGSLFPQDAHAIALCSDIDPPSIQIDFAGGQSFTSNGSITVASGTVLDFYVYTRAEPSTANDITYPYQPRSSYTGPAGNYSPPRHYTSNPIDSQSSIVVNIYGDNCVPTSTYGLTTLTITINVPAPVTPAQIHVVSNLNTSWQVHGAETFEWSAGTSANYSTTNFGTYNISVSDIGCYDKAVSPSSINATEGSDSTFTITYTNNGSCNAPPSTNGSCSSTHYNCAAGNLGSTTEDSSFYRWTCNGTNGGSNASCSESKPAPPLTPTDGQCATTHYSCVQGNSVSNNESSAQYTWTCNGINGGSAATCSENKPGGLPPGNSLPIANLDAANCSIIGGWAFDPDVSGQSIDVHIHRDGPAGSSVDAVATTANGDRPDVDAYFGISGNHGFTISTPGVYKDGNAHSGYLYAIGEGGSPDDAIYFGSFNIAAGQCPPPTPPAPTSIASSCNNAGTLGTMTWDLPNGYNLSYARIQDTTTGGMVGLVPEWAADSGGGNPHSISVTTSPGHSYHGWVHTRTSDPSNYSDLVDTYFSCNLPGCTNPAASNYNSSATVDDGSCVVGCTGPASQTCTSGTNACGQTNTGTQTRTCNSSNGSWSAWSACSVSTPANPAGYGNACTGSTSVPNACGMTNAGGSGTIQCNGTCNASNGVTPPNTSCPAPTASSVTYSTPDYCSSGPGGYIAWSYSDPNNSPQASYQVQITDTGNFNSPMYDSGQVNSSSKVFSIPAGTLAFNTTYKARVRIWNSYTAVSSWSSSTSSWKTPAYSYPNVSPPYQFTWPTSPKPQQSQSLQFTDHTVFGGGNSNSRQWSWNFGDGGTSTQQNPTHTYATNGNYTIQETVTDAANQSCTYSQNVSVQKPVPVIKEVAPR